MSSSWRLKVCLLGSSEGGKTSLIHSLIADAPSLTRVDDRTIGIDRYKWTIADDDSRPHDVMFWDFAGQDVYQAAHTLFFSQRTLYLLCVDLNKYSEALLDHEKEPIALNRDAKTQRYVQYHVLRWAGMIVARQPDASIFVVGTKSDLLTQKQISRVSVDLHLRIDSWFKDAWFALRGDDRPHVPAAKTSLKSFRNSQMIVLNVVTEQAVVAARAAIEKTILSVSSIGITMTPVYTQVLDVIERSRVESNRTRNADPTATRFSEATPDQLDKVVVKIEEFTGKLVNQIDGLDRAQCEQILMDLHDLGDLLWYRREHLGDFLNTAILDPDLVLDLVRELVNHTHVVQSGAEYDALRQGGEVRDSLLMDQPHWKVIAALESDYVLMFKKLMQDYELAYPVGPDEMTTKSDLIVPTYWKVKRQERPTTSLLRSESVISRDLLPQSHYGFWQYAVPIDVSEPIFDQFIVRSHSKHMSRRVTATCVESTKAGILTARVYYEVGVGKMDHIRIEVVASSDAMCWKTVRFFVLAMEVVLENYPGLKGVGRNILYRDPASPSLYQSFEVILAVKALQDERTFAMGDGYARRERPWLPPNLDWFADKVWQRPQEVEKMKEKEREAENQRQLQVMTRLAGSPEKKRVVPALWMLVVRDVDLHEVEVLLLSDLSGICCHKTWKVTPTTAFKTKYSKYIKAGVSIFSTVEKRFLSDGINSSVLASARSAMTNPVQSDTVSNYIGQPELGSGASALSASGMLRDLLNVKDDTQAIGIMANASLVCGRRSDSNAYIWASEDDFKRSSADVVPTAQLLAEIARAASLPASVMVHLQITTANGIPESECENAWCSWEIVYKGSVKERGETRRNGSSKTIKWTTQFTLQSVKSLPVLHECTLRVRVKRPSRVPVLPPKTIAHGSQALEKYVAVDRISSPVYLTVELGASSALACTLTIIGDSR